MKKLSIILFSAVSIAAHAQLTISGVNPISGGGTNSSTANGALNNLLPSQSGQSGKVLTTDGTNTSWEAAGGVGPTGPTGAQGIQGPTGPTGSGSTQWTTSGYNIYYTTGNVSVGTSSNSASSKFNLYNSGSAPTIRLDGGSTNELYMDWSESGVQKFFIDRFPSSYGTTSKRNQVDIRNVAGSVRLSAGGGNYDQVFIAADGSCAGNVGINNLSPVAALHVKSKDTLASSMPALKVSMSNGKDFAIFDNNRKLTLKGNQDSAIFVLWSDAYIQTDAGFHPIIDFREYSAAYTPFAQIGQRQHTGSGTNAFYSLVFKVSESPASTPTEVMSLTGKGKVIMPTIPTYTSQTAANAANVAGTVYKIDVGGIKTLAITEFYETGFFDGDRNNDIFREWD